MKFMSIGKCMIWLCIVSGHEIEVCSWILVLNPSKRCIGTLLALINGEYGHVMYILLCFYCFDNRI